MSISSRTPEGTPNRCEICGHRVRVEPSLGTLDAPCPCCGHLLWFARTAARRHAPRESLAYSAGVLVGKLLRVFRGAWKEVTRPLAS